MPGAWAGSPATFTPGELMTDVIMNAEVRDRMLWLGGLTGAITQIGSATGITGGPTTTSAANVDMTDMTVTLTTTLGSDLLVWYWCTYTCSTTALLTVTASYDGSDQSASITSITSAAGNIVIPWFVRVANTTAGSHTVKGRWATSAGTATAAGAQRALIVLEVKR